MLTAKSVFAADVTLDFSDLDGLGAKLDTDLVAGSGGQVINNFGGVSGLTATATSSSGFATIQESDFELGGEFVIRAGVSESRQITFSFNREITGSVEAITSFGDNSIQELISFSTVSGTLSGTSAAASSNFNRTISYDSGNSGPVNIGSSSTPALTFSAISQLTVSYTCPNDDGVVDGVACGSLVNTWVISGKPTITIVATEVSDGDASSDTNISLTFTASEPTNDFTFTDVDVTNGVLSNFVTVSSTVYTATFTPTTAGSTAIDVPASSFTDSTGDANLAAQQFNWTYASVAASNPMPGADVTALIQATGESVSMFGATSLRLVNRRLRWLERNGAKRQRSRQGVSLTFEDALLNELFSGGRDDPELLADTTSRLVELVNSPTIFADRLRSETIKLAASKSRDALGLTKQSQVSDKTIAGWSIWSEGRIAVGRLRKSASSAERDSENYAMAIGMDRDIGPKTLLGLSLALGKDDVDIGATGSNLNSDHVSLTGYYSTQVAESFTTEFAVGIGQSKMATRRVGGTETLIGNRDADVMFGSATIRKATISIRGATVSPYSELQLTKVRLNDFSESGGSSAMVYESQAFETRFISAGADVDLYLNGGASLRPFAQFELTHDFSDSSQANVRYVGSNTIYTLNTDKISKTRARAGIGFDYAAGRHLTLTGSVEREQFLNAGHLTSATFKVNYEF